MREHKAIGCKIVYINAHLRAFEDVVVKQLLQSHGQWVKAFSRVGKGVDDDRVFRHNAIGAQG